MENDKRGYKRTEGEDCRIVAKTENYFGKKKC